MRRIGLLLLVILMNIYPVFSQSVSIPDTAFLHALIDLGVDANGDGLISPEEAEEITSLRISEKGISDLAGIEAFVNLDTLDCRRNQLSMLDISGNTTLVYLDLFFNQLSNLSVKPAHFRGWI